MPLKVRRVATNREAKDRLQRSSCRRLAGQFGSAVTAGATRMLRLARRSQKPRHSFPKPGENRYCRLGEQSHLYSHVPQQECPCCREAQARLSISFTRPAGHLPLKLKLCQGDNSPIFAPAVPASSAVSGTGGPFKRMVTRTADREMASSERTSVQPSHLPRPTADVPSHTSGAAMCANSQHRM